MSAVGLVVSHDPGAATDLARELAAWLGAEGHAVALVAEDAAVIGLEALGRESESFGSGLDLAVCLGGDGTMLRTVALVHGNDVPVLGVNVGTLGYLTEVEAGAAQAALARFFAGDYAVEDRMMVQASIEGLDVPVSGLNEVTVEKTPRSHTVKLSVYLHDEFFTTYVADGIIIATPTGSTAYSFSARGPIVTPTHRLLVVNAVAPHMLFDRVLVLSPDDHVRMVVEGGRPAVVSVDGRQIAVLGEGDVVTCTAAPTSARLVRLGNRTFHGILKSKFGLNDR
jgi:NAD+ kinase